MSSKPGAGQSDQIIREFVWQELKDVEGNDTKFDAEGRILWVGLTKYLTLAHGVKSVVNPVSLARRLTFDDLGVAGRAALSGVLSRTSNSYLDLRPEKRPHPPDDLVNWISGNLDVASKLGFLKKQSSTAAAQYGRRPTELYELTHDALGDIFQRFAIEFEAWIRARIFIAGAVVVIALIIIPLFAVIAATAGLGDAMYFLGSLIFGGALYGFLFFVFAGIFKFALAIFAYPIIRWLSRGSVPEPQIASETNAAL